jgi:hypothetical protein
MIWRCLVAMIKEVIAVPPSYMCDGGKKEQKKTSSAAGRVSVIEREGCVLVWMDLQVEVEAGAQVITHTARTNMGIEEIVVFGTQIPRTSTRNKNI